MKSAASETVSTPLRRPMECEGPFGRVTIHQVVPVGLYEFERRSYRGYRWLTHAELAAARCLTDASRCQHAPREHWLTRPVDLPWSRWASP
jgi:hypothetical protein